MKPSKKVKINGVFFDERGWILLELENGKTARIKVTAIEHDTGYDFKDPNTD